MVFFDMIGFESTSPSTTKAHRLFQSRCALWIGLAVMVVVAGQSSVNADCGPDFCLGMICLYGRAYDSDGCIICDCSYPCEDTNCSASQQCQPVRVVGCDGIRCPMYAGQCTDIAPTTTRQPCPALSCSSSSGTCRFGYKTVNGCPTCQCVDLCENYPCAVGQKCQLSADDCVPAPGVQCRDAPMPYCVPNVQSPSTSTSLPTVTIPAIVAATTTTSSSTPSSTSTSSAPSSPSSTSVFSTTPSTVLSSTRTSTSSTSTTTSPLPTTTSTAVMSSTSTSSAPSSPSSTSVFSTTPSTVLSSTRASMSSTSTTTSPPPTTTSTAVMSSTSTSSAPSSPSSTSVFSTTPSTVLSSTRTSMSSTSTTTSPPPTTTSTAVMSSTSTSSAPSSPSSTPVFSTTPSTVLSSTRTSMSSTSTTTSPPPTTTSTAVVSSSTTSSSSPTTTTIASSSTQSSTSKSGSDVVGTKSSAGLPLPVSTSSTSSTTVTTTTSAGAPTSTSVSTSVSTSTSVASSTVSTTAASSASSSASSPSTFPSTSTQSLTAMSGGSSGSSPGTSASLTTSSVDEPSSPSVPTSESTSMSSSTTSTTSNLVSIQAVIRIGANFSIIDNPNDFQGSMENEISLHLAVGNDSVKITRLENGSIIVYFIVIVPLGNQYDEVKRRATAWSSNGAEVGYKGNLYQARLVSFNESNTTSIAWSRPAAVDSNDFLLVIVLLCVLIPLGVALIVIVIAVSVVCWRKHKRAEQWMAISRGSSVDSSPGISKQDVASHRADFESGRYHMYKGSVKSSVIPLDETFA